MITSPSDDLGDITNQGFSVFDDFQKYSPQIFVATLAVWSGNLILSTRINLDPTFLLWLSDICIIELVSRLIFFFLKSYKISASVFRFIYVYMYMLFLGAFKGFLLLTLLTPELLKDKLGHIKNLKSSIEQKHIWMDHY